MRIILIFPRIIPDNYFLLAILFYFLELTPAIAQFPAIPSFTVNVYDTTAAGYYFISPHKPDPFKSPYSSFNMILDKNGNILYLKKFPSRLKLIDFKLQPNGLMSYYLNDKFFLVDSSFHIVDSIFGKNNLSKDPHDLQVLPNGNYVLTAAEKYTLDANKIPFKVKNDTSKQFFIYCAVLQEQDSRKNIVFEWHSKDHFKLTDMDTSYLSISSSVDWTHVNSIAFCKDGNYLISLRNFNEVTKINRADGTIMWRLGGKANQFRFTNDPDKFIAQHDVRELTNGHITLLDNGKSSSPVHPVIAKEYQLDEKNLEAKLVWSYTENRQIHSNQGLGNVSRIANGNTLINYGKCDGSDIMFNVINPSGKKSFEIRFEDSLRTYRAFYYPVLPFKLKRPSVTYFKKEGKTYLKAQDDYKSYQWSNGEITQTILITAPGTYSVFVPVGDGGFISSPPFKVKDL